MKKGLSLRKELGLECLRGEDCWHMFKDLESPSFQIGLFLKTGVSFSFPAHYVRVDCEPEQEERSLFGGCPDWPGFTPGNVVRCGAHPCPLPLCAWACLAAPSSGIVLLGGCRPSLCEKRWEVSGRCCFLQIECKIFF